MPDSSDPDQTGEPSRKAQTPREPRYSVMLSAVVERFGRGGSTKHRVRNLSTSGVRIDQAVNLQVGATVLVSVGTLEAVGATIVWIKNGEAGLKFAQPVDLDEARSRAAIAPKKSGSDTSNGTAGGPSAGWIGDLNSPYRK